MIGVNGCWLVALFTFAAAVFGKIFFEKVGQILISMLPVLIALFAGYIFAIILGIVDFTNIPVDSIDCISNCNCISEE